MKTARPVLLPPEEPPQGTLSPWVPWIAVLGVAALGLVTVPATLERRRLDAVHARLASDIRREEAALERLERLEREAGHAPYVRERELRKLLNPQGETR